MPYPTTYDRAFTSIRTRLSSLSIDIKRQIKISPNTVQYGDIMLYLYDALWIKSGNLPRFYDWRGNMMCVDLYHIRYKDKRTVNISVCGNITGQYEVYFYDDKDDEIFYHQPIEVSEKHDH